MRVLVGSVNPVKVAAVQEVFASYFSDVEVVGVAVESGVPTQPVGDETFEGAENRVRALLRLNGEQGLGAQYCVGLEGGINQLHGRWFSYGVLCVADTLGRLSFGLSPLYEMPPILVADVLAGEELGHVVDRSAAIRRASRRAAPSHS